MRMIYLEPTSMMVMAIIAEPVEIALGSSEKGNAIQPGKPRKKTMTSMFLRYFDTAADGKAEAPNCVGRLIQFPLPLVSPFLFQNLSSHSYTILQWGQEGRQAVMASDFAMGQFRFLVPLLLVHGH